MKSFCSAIAFVALVCSGAAIAHDTWLLASDYEVKPGETITLGMTSGMDFPAADYAIKPERVEKAFMRLSGEKHSLEIAERGEHALRFEASPGAAGTALFHVALGANPIELTPEDVQHYLTEIGAPERVWEAWRATPEPREWHEEYTKYAQAYVSVGESESGTWQPEPLGLPLEFVLQQNPGTLRAGDTLVLQVLKDGEPYAGFSVGVVNENEKAEMLRTNADGEVEIALNGSGRYMIRGTDITPPGEDDNDVWTSNFVTATFAVEE